MKVFNWETEFTHHNEEWSLKPILEALKDLGNPHLKLKNIIHIAGTNGKGSTAKFTYQILRENGYDVGLFTSPHLVEYNERFLFNDKSITDEEIEKYRSIVIKKCKNSNTIHYFEITTIIAVLWFYDKIEELKKMSNYDEKKVWFIFEVGLGGRLDATNIFEKTIAVITSISYDHMEKLGNTLSQIACEKAGIIKPNCPIFTSNTKQEIVDGIKNIANEKKAKLFCQGVDYKLDTTLKPSLEGKHQFENATLAKEVCKYIGIDEKTIKKGISNTKWIGRLQKIHIDNLEADDIYIDGAHNEGGIKVLCNFVEDINSKYNDANIIGVYSCLKRKDYKNFVSIISKTKFDKMLFYNIQNSDKNMEFVDTKELVGMYEGYFKCGVIDDLLEIKDYFAEDKKNIVIIFGSLYFVGFIFDRYKLL